jgi:FkbH-like protein
MTLSLPELLESFITATSPADRDAHATSLVTGIREAIKKEDWRAATETLRKAADPRLDFTTAQALARLLKRLTLAGHAGAAPKRVAVLSSFTVDQLVPMIELFGFAAGVPIRIHHVPYGTFRQEILDPGSELTEFAPQFIFLATNSRDLMHVPTLHSDRDAVAQAVEREYAEWHALWSVAHERWACQVIQNNFELPPVRALDNHEIRHPASFAGFVTRVNLALADRAPPFVTIHDADHLASRFGRLHWADPRHYQVAKFPCAPEAQVDYAHSVASLVVSSTGLAKKCLVLDLDNTLWGGVIGDDGLGGIQLGQGNPEGEAFSSFQQYALSLRQRGVILAVCSKNDEHNAKEPFERHSEMVLGLEDISCFVANWNDMASNLRVIAQRLNIGLDSLVFVDDNPAERAIVRQLVPEVSVPEMPVDPAGYVYALEGHRYFQTLFLEAEDFKRTDFYRANAEREMLLQATPGDIGGYLASLRMTSRLASIDEHTVERCTQLINKSNQFNLTTRRYSVAEVLARSGDPEWVTVSATLADRFGDNGLISVAMARAETDALRIDTWLMSCRVLKRGVERQMLNHLAEQARQRGLRRLEGEYIPSAKNSMVARHYEVLGFQPNGNSAEGATLWELDLSAWQPLTTHIEVLRDE